MDPIMLSSAFATIVGLICNFKQERKDEKELTNKDFIEWLEVHQFFDIKTYILNNQLVASNLELLMKENYETLIFKLNEIDDILASLVSQIEGFKGIVKAIKPNVELSAQAISILRQLVKSSSDEFGQLGSMGASETLLLTAGGVITFTEPRFLDDDLTTLVKLGLLRIRIAPGGSKFFGVTRNAAKLIDAIERD